MIKDILVPDIGGFTDVAVIDVFIAAGDEIETDSPLLSLESDKAVMDIPSPYSGQVTEVLVTADDTVSEGSLIARVDVVEQAEDNATDDTAVTESQPRAGIEAGKADNSASMHDAASESTAGTAVTAGEVEKIPGLPETDPGTGRQDPEGRIFHAAPGTRLYARELGVTLDRVRGTGPAGRITRSDIQQYVRGILPGPDPGNDDAVRAFSGAGPAEPAGQTQAGRVGRILLEDFTQYGEVERVPLPRLKKISGPRIHEGWLNTPQVTHFEESDISVLEELRGRYNKQSGEGQGVSILPFVIKAVIQVLKLFPNANSSLDTASGEIIRKRYYNIGIAVDTPGGLIVPVLKQADSKSVREIGNELKQMGERARSGTLKADELRGGSFSISSLGGIGGTQFTPLVNAPEAAILGVSRMSMQQVWNGKEFIPGMILPFSLSYDHRVMDGAEAARFCRTLAAFLRETAWYVVT